MGTVGSHHSLIFQAFGFLQGLPLLLLSLLLFPLQLPPGDKGGYTEAQLSAGSLGSAHKLGKEITGPSHLPRPWSGEPHALLQPLLLELVPHLLNPLLHISREGLKLIL